MYLYIKTRNRNYKFRIIMIQQQQQSFFLGAPPARSRTRGCGPPRAPTQRSPAPRVSAAVRPRTPHQPLCQPTPGLPKRPEGNMRGQTGKKNWGQKLPVCIQNKGREGGASGPGVLYDGPGRFTNWGVFESPPPCEEVSCRQIGAGKKGADFACNQLGECRGGGLLPGRADRHPYWYRSQINPGKGMGGRRGAGTRT